MNGVKGAKGAKETRPAVFLDRDGTMIEDPGYLSEPDEVRLLPGAGRAVSMLNRAGLPVVVVTNQSGIGRGFFRAERLGEIHARLEEVLAEEGARIDGIYFCPHLPQDRCRCRKPAPGMVERACGELGLDPEKSYVVGDKASDVGLARNVGAKAVLVMTGEGRDELRKMAPAGPDHSARDLVGAVKWILRDAGIGLPREGAGT